MMNRLIFYLLILAQSFLALAQNNQPQLASTLKFSHETHNGLSQAKCEDCHNLSYNKNPYPTMNTCGKCHGETKAPDGSKACLVCHTNSDDYTVILPNDTRNSDPDKKSMWDKIRSNFAHFSSGHEYLDCRTCHTKILQSQFATDDNFPRREDCGKCHQVVDNGNPKACVMCHQLNHNANSIQEFLKKTPPHSF